jgi:Fic family protein
LSLETPSGIEPARLEEPTGPIADAIAELTASAATLGKALHPRTAGNLADLVRIMNTYYSNLIEGHNTRPRDIERALAGELDKDEQRRDLQLEAAAHVRVQREVDRMAGEGELPAPASREFLRWLHREFYRDAPESALLIQTPERMLRMTPGEWRKYRAGWRVGSKVALTTNGCWITPILLVRATSTGAATSRRRPFRSLSSGFCESAWIRSLT